MRTLLAAGLGLFLIVSANACSIVQIVDFLPASQNSKIAVLKDGKPQDSLTVIVSSASGGSQFSLVTDSEGSVRLPKLPPGSYCISAIAAPSSADICLSIGTQEKAANSFSMNLVKSLGARALDAKIESAKHATPTEHIRRFAGVVQDPLGAVIVDARVRVFLQSSGDIEDAKNTVSDNHGRFAISLDPGRYTAVIESHGFATRVLVFEVSDGAKELQPIKLDLASSCG